MPMPFKIMYYTNINMKQKLRKDNWLIVNYLLLYVNYVYNQKFSLIVK